MRRLRERDPHLSEEDARNRVLSQGDVREKARRVVRRGSGRGIVIWNDGGKDDLKRDVDRVMEELRRSSPKWWSWLLWACPPLAGMVGLISWWRMRTAQLQWEEEKRREKAKL
jgi:dephospho-CoA kinase